MLSSASSTFGEPSSEDEDRLVLLLEPRESPPGRARRTLKDGSLPSIATRRILSAAWARLRGGASAASTGGGATRSRSGPNREQLRRWEDCCRVVLARCSTATTE